MSKSNVLIRFHEGDPIVDRAMSILMKDSGEDDIFYTQSFLQRNQREQYLSRIFTPQNIFKT